MAKARLEMRNGAKVTIEGTAEEVAVLIGRLGENEDASTAASRKPPASKVSQEKRAEKPTPINLIGSLIDGGFFKKPKDLAAVKTALEEQGHYFPVTTLSPSLLRLVRKHQLRRIKDSKRWLYNG